MRKLISVFVLLSSVSLLYAQQVPFTMEDRERIIRLEDEVNKLEKDIARLEERINALNQRIDDLRSEMKSRFDDTNNKINILIALIVALIGFIIWDRRTALQPAIRRIEELERREKERLELLRETAKDDPQLAEKLKKIGLL